MPQQTRRSRAVRAPCACATRECFRRWPRPQLPQLAHRFEQCEIGSWKDIRTTQGEEQIALRRPWPDTVKRVKSGRGVDIRKHRERVEVERLLLELRRERREIRGLLSRHAEPTEPRFAQHRDIRRCHRSGRTRDPRVHGARLRERDLLLEHEKDESFETGLAWPERRWAMSLHDVREARLVARERADSPRKSGLVQWNELHRCRGVGSLCSAEQSLRERDQCFELERLGEERIRVNSRSGLSGSFGAADDDDARTASGNAPVRVGEPDTVQPG